jgi:hypothetical protein
MMVEEGAKEAVAQAVAQAGGHILPLRVARDGLRVETQA